MMHDWIWAWSSSCKYGIESPDNNAQEDELCTLYNLRYEPGEEDELRRPDNTTVNFTAGEDLLRISYDSSLSQAGVNYQYLVRRVAKLENGTLVKTPNYYEQLARAARRENVCFSNEPYIHAVQACSFVPSFHLPEFTSDDSR